MSHDGFIDHCLELLAPMGRPRARRMFGGHGLYLDDLFVAIVADDQLYLKTDAATCDRFAAAGGVPFVYVGNGKTARMGFHTVPPDAMESPPAMHPWLRLAVQAAVAARAAKAPRRR